VAAEGRARPVAFMALAELRWPMKARGGGGLLHLKGGVREVRRTSIGKEEDEGGAHQKTMVVVTLSPNPS
jgi:hypothetical protein